LTKTAKDAIMGFGFDKQRVNAYLAKSYFKMVVSLPVFLA
jgi:hypothetical protein